MDPRTQLLLEAPIGRTILRLALPNIAVMAIQAGIGLVETYFIAKLGTDALAGLALVFPVQMLFVMITAGAMGGGILSAVSRALGSGRTDDANALVWQSVWIALALGIVTTVALLSAGHVLYSAMGGRGEALAAALVYSHVVFAGAIPLWLYNSLAAVIRGTGNMLVPALVTAIGAAILIPLSPLLIFGA
jgi:Na+-driven multidrug efflux pump